MFNPIYKQMNNYNDSIPLPMNSKPYFKQGAIVQPKDCERFIKKYAFTTEAQLAQTQLRPIPTDKEIANKIRNFSTQNKFIKHAQDYIQNPNKEHVAYNYYLENNIESIKKVFQYAHETIESPSSSETEISISHNLVEHEKFILNDYKKRGLKDFIINQIVSPTTDKKKIKFLYTLKTKYFDSDLSDEVRKIVQRIYDDFGIIMFPANNKKIATKVYHYLEEAHKIPLSVGDKIPHIKVIDMTSIYKTDYLHGSGNYDCSGYISSSLMFLNEMDNTLKHEISGHAMHYSNNKKYYEKVLKNGNKIHLHKYFKEKGVEFDFLTLNLLFQESKIPDYKNEMKYMMKDPLEFVAVIKEHSNFLPFDTLEGTLKKVQKMLEALSTPKGFFADRVILPKEFAPSQWKEFATKMGITTNLNILQRCKQICLKR